MMTARSVRTEYSKILLELEHSKLLKSHIPQPSIPADQPRHAAAA